MIDKIFNEDCLVGMQRIPDKSVDCIICDPPYLLSGNTGGGFWSKSNGNHYNARGSRKGMEKLENIKDGISNDILDEMCRVMKKTNIYIFCNQRQIRQYMDYFIDKRKCNWNLLMWHKTNPIPACGNKYLNDTEYIMFFRGKGVRLYGSYETKRTFYTTLRNQQENTKCGHPTVKPCHIIQNFIVNSSLEVDVILDPFIGSGTTAVACVREKRHFIGFELEKRYYDIACKRIEEERQNLKLEFDD